MKRNSILLSVCLCLCFFTKAQNTKNNSSDTKTNLVKTWYEYPHESNGNTIMYRAQKYAKDYTKDNPAYEFSELKFANNTDFTVAYWRWCPKVNYTANGTWALSNDEKTISLSFGQNMCKCEATILEKGSDFIKVIIKEQE